MSVFANELLLRIFAHLDRRTLRKVALANRTFSRLARTLLFSHFAVSRYVTCPEKRKHDPVSASQLLHLSQCLDFWTSEEIAPLVRSCEISPRRWADEQVVVPQLLATFFDHIERFAALRRLNLSRLQLTGLAVSTLARLPMLSELTLQDCGIANGDSMPSVSNTSRLFHLYTLRLFHLLYGLSEGVEEWLPLLEPSCLHVLHTNAAANNGAVIPVFPDVHDLVVCINEPPTPADITFLQKFPGVTKLGVYLKWTNSPQPPPTTLPADVFPVLAEFRGSFHALPVLLGRDTLTRIEIYEDSIDVFIMELQRLPAPLTNVIHLAATFGSSCTAPALEAFFTSLPRLEDVKITFQDDSYDPAPARILSRLPSIPGISSRLQRLCLIWISQTVDSIESDCNFPAVRAALMVQCPDLEFLWLDGRDFIYCWHTQADNMAETDVMVTDPEDVEGVRLSWESSRQLPGLVYEDEDA